MKFYNIGPWVQFTSVIYKFSFKARTFVPDKLLKPGLTNIRAYYKNSLKSFITLGPGYKVMKALSQVRSIFLLGGP